jgi:hypothetical protein
VIVDAGTLSPGRDALLAQVRGLGATIPIAVMAPEDLEGLATALRANLDAEVDRERNRREVLEAQLLGYRNSADAQRKDLVATAF